MKALGKRVHVIAIVCLGAALAACSACAGSAKAVRSHSHVAQTLEDLSVEARGAVLELREGELRRAGVAAREAGADPSVAVQAAAVEFDERPLIPAVNLFVSAKQAYVRGLLVTLQDEKPSFATLRPLLADVVAAYESLRQLAADRLKLPPIPEVLVALL